MKTFLILVAALAGLQAAPLAAQDTLIVKVSRDSSMSGDSSSGSRLQRLRTAGRRLGSGSIAVARRGARTIFAVDSTVELLSRHPDPASGVLRHVAPVAFWVPVVAVVATPLVWAEEAEDRNHLNAQYARSATTALALGFLASRATKHFIRRTRPCGMTVALDSLGVGAPTSHCAGSLVRSDASFFSEHAMAAFAIASAATFQAQRQDAPNANAIAGLAMTAATGVAISRIYQHHHWLSDVVVAAAVGTASGFLSAQLAPRRAAGR
ncbi:MAG: phosphatase PAP2 family protein [Gemmatimonadaceae bacterium]